MLCRVNANRATIMPRRMQAIIPEKHAGSERILLVLNSFLLPGSKRDNATMKKRSEETERGV